MPLNVSLPEKLEKLVHHEVSSGRFRSVEAVIEEAVRLMLDQSSEFEQLRAKIDRGFAEAEAGLLFEPDVVRARLRARHDERVKSLKRDARDL